MTSRPLTRADILPMEAYARIRDARRREMTAIKQHRRVTVGPDITFYFESFETMLHQVHEMLFIEKGGEAQIEDELRAYGPLIPGGTNLVATMMIEIDEPGRRARVLSQLGGVEETVFFEVAGSRVAAVPEGDVERTTPDGKTSSVHFLKFPFAEEQIAAFRTPGSRILLGIDHSNYAHLAVLPEGVRESLVKDFA
ncbi:MAG: DUF3501 family protein [Rhodospirillales bacterium]